MEMVFKITGIQNMIESIDNRDQTEDSLRDNLFENRWWVKKNHRQE